ncbi:MAG: ImmA/IrrE family metallo-endopeptidase [Chloroflexi bacterium]|nr:ImmA/IrrE family metallo-endopeptidase [Chloroflexota bacterium]
MIEKVIKTEKEYQIALEELEPLMDAVPGSKEEQELELLALLIEKYEDEHFPISLPDPVDAIKFRMEQQGLTQKELIPYLGSQSKVSEILNRKRPLTLTMIRNLHEGLEIPAEVLIQKAGAIIPDKQYDRDDYPFNEMFSREYFPFFSGKLTLAKQQAEECLEEFFSVFHGKQQSLVLCKNSEGDVDQNALFAWQAQVLTKANQGSLLEFDPSSFGSEIMDKVVHLSAYTTGPLKAREFLASLGIPLIFLQHLPHTYQDGACFLSPAGRPVIGMTLRHDRQDNFWFTLLHELSHVYLHLMRGDDLVFADNTERVDPQCDGKEQEANVYCSDRLIPSEVWMQERDRLLNGADSSYFISLAEKLNICPAIIAGRIRQEKGDYTLYDNMLGRGEVRILFGGAE